jgi:hypothetical protein
MNEIKIGDRVRLVEWPKDQRCMWERTPGELGRVVRIEQFENGSPAFCVRLDWGGATFMLAPEHICPESSMIPTETDEHVRARLTDMGCIEAAVALPHELDVLLMKYRLPPRYVTRTPAPGP